MKVMFVSGNMPHYDCGMSKVTRFAQDIFTELGLDVDEVNIGYAQIPFFDGIKSQATDDIVMRIRDASGVVLACSAQLYAPTAIMQSFLEYFLLDEYNDALRGKHFFLVTVSKEGGERSALDYMSRVVQNLGGYVGGRIGLQEAHIRAIDTDPEVRGFIEKETEDFYRALRQDRKYIIPRDSSCRENLSTMTVTDVPTWSTVPEKKEKTPVSEVYKKLNMDAFTEQQEKDIQELTRFFSEKYSLPDDSAGEAAYAAAPPAAKPAVKPRQKTLRQTTQSLPHYYQPQLSNGLTATVQFNISGSETFDGFLSILSTECVYTEGIAANPDITIIADSEVWGDVMKHKYTAQKAFMIGGLKVRGNFVLLTKFDALFKLG